ncbi:unnamed protein product [Closterium sp. NIES-64]|nr:unnamed protein product [Closterium sp. NIES-64]
MDCAFPSQRAAPAVAGPAGANTSSALLREPSSSVHGRGPGESLAPRERQGQWHERRHENREGGSGRWRRGSESSASVEFAGGPHAGAMISPWGSSSASASMNTGRGSSAHVSHLDAALIGPTAAAAFTADVHAMAWPAALRNPGPAVHGGAGAGEGEGGKSDAGSSIAAASAAQLPSNTTRPTTASGSKSNSSAAVNSGVRNRGSSGRGGGQRPSSRRPSAQIRIDRIPPDTSAETVATFVRDALGVIVDHVKIKGYTRIRALPAGRATASAASTGGAAGAGEGAVVGGTREEALVLKGQQLALQCTMEQCREPEGLLSHATVHLGFIHQPGQLALTWRSKPESCRVEFDFLERHVRVVVQAKADVWQLEPDRWFPDDGDPWTRTTEEHFLPAGGRAGACTSAAAGACVGVGDDGRGGAGAGRWDSGPGSSGGRGVSGWKGRVWSGGVLGAASVMQVSVSVRHGIHVRRIAEHMRTASLHLRARYLGDPPRVAITARYAAAPPIHLAPFISLDPSGNSSGSAVPAVLAFPVLYLLTALVQQGTIPPTAVTTSLYRTLAYELVPAAVAVLMEFLRFSRPEFDPARKFHQIARAMRHHGRLQTRGGTDTGRAKEPEGTREHQSERGAEQQGSVVGELELQPQSQQEQRDTEEKAGEASEGESSTWPWRLPANHVVVFRLLITPLGAQCCMPGVELTNRVLTHYRPHAHRFLRVAFTDEGLKTLSPFALRDAAGRREGVAGHTNVYRRILSLVEEGFSLCGRHYRFLALSASQLREKSAWFLAEDDALSLTVASVQHRAFSFPHCHHERTPLSAFHPRVSSLNLPHHLLSLCMWVHACGCWCEWVSVANRRGREGGWGSERGEQHHQAWMGTFSAIRNVAKCAARMGQCFSARFTSLPLPRAHVRMIPDVTRGNLCFTDGVDAVSPEAGKALADAVAPYLDRPVGAGWSDAGSGMRAGEGDAGGGESGGSCGGDVGGAAAEGGSGNEEIRSGRVREGGSANEKESWSGSGAGNTKEGGSANEKESWSGSGAGSSGAKRKKGGAAERGRALLRAPSAFQI